MGKNIYLLYLCDEWNGYGSFRLIMASIDEKKIRKEIKIRINEGEMEYSSYIEDLDNKSLYDLDICLKYGNIQIVEDGEIC